MCYSPKINKSNKNNKINKNRVDMESIPSIRDDQYQN